jgi:hypothetical protein
MNSTLQQLQLRLETSLQGLDATQTQLRPAAHPSKWSIQQIVEHLLLTYASSGDVFEARIAKGRPTLAKPGLVQTFCQWGVFRLGYFPTGRKAPAAVIPPANIPRSSRELDTAIIAELTHFDHISDRAESVLSPAGRITHAVLGPLTVQQWREFQLCHGTHHVKQILAIRRDHNI